MELGFPTTLYLKDFLSLLPKGALPLMCQENRLFHLCLLSHILLQASSAPLGTHGHMHIYYPPELLDFSPSPWDALISPGSSGEEVNNTILPFTFLPLTSNNSLLMAT